jgi:hypothetical protein
MIKEHVYQVVIFGCNALIQERESSAILFSYQSTMEINHRLEEGLILLKIQVGELSAQSDQRLSRIYCLLCENTDELCFRTSRNYMAEVLMVFI